MIVVVGQPKGGVAKTSLALALAIRRASQGRGVLLVDADEQQTASKFVALRTSLEHDGARYQTAAYTGRAVRDQVRTLAPRFQDTIIDVGGRNTDSLRAALMVANRLVVPVPAASFEVWEIETMDELVGEAQAMNERLDAISVLSMADHRRPRNNAEAVTALKEAQHVSYSGVLVHSRVAWQEAQAAPCSRWPVLMPRRRTRSKSSRPPLSDEDRTRISLIRGRYAKYIQLFDVPVVSRALPRPLDGTPTRFRPRHWLSQTCWAGPPAR